MWEKCGKNAFEKFKTVKIGKNGGSNSFFGGVAGKNPVNNGVKRPTRERPNGTPHLRIAYFGGF